MTVARRDGVLTIANGRLHFTPEVYPVEHLRNEGWRKEPDGSWTATATSQSLVTIKRLFPSVEWEGQWPGFSEPFPQPQTTVLRASKPDSWDRLYPYQQRAAQWLAEQRSALLGYAPGLGKTPVTLVALQIATPRPLRGVLIICPLTLLLNWHQEAKKWWPQAKVVLQEPEIFSLTDTAPLLSVITYDTFRQSVYDRVQQGKKPDGTPRWVYVPRKATLLEWKCRADVLIFDESVLLKNRQAVRTKAAAAARKVIPICWELSGSPTTRFYDDLWAQLHILEPKQYTSYWRFARSCTLIQDSVWGKSVVANVPNIEPTLKRDLAPIMLTYNYTDLAREEPERAIPEWVFETRQVPLPEKWWRLYKQMQDRFMADLPDGTRILAPNTLARLVRLLQFASHPALLAQEPLIPVEADGMRAVELVPSYFEYDWSAKGGKLSAIPELLDELPGPTIVWTNFIATAKHLSETLKTPCLIGETPAEERTRIVAEFQAGQHPMLIAHPGVGRFGLTLTRARSAIYAERSYDGDAWIQSLARIRRIGTVEPPQVVILEATGPNGEASIDRAISRVLSYRKDRSEQLTTALLKETLR